MGVDRGIAIADDAVASALDWWALAGVDTLVEETPRDWLKPAAAPAPAATPEPAPVAADLPETLPALVDWLAATADLPWDVGQRIRPTGDPASGTMILIDMPEDRDAATSLLVGGAAGPLLDGMLAAIGLARPTIYLAPFAPAHLIGRMPEDARALLVRAQRRHLALAAPRRLLLMGDGVARALTGQPLAAARGRWLDVTHDGGSVRAVATFSARFLLQQPQQKRAAWADLQLFERGA